eukprot:GHUV01014894.1.p1 GENE.GHUV01014894.1~~GHUV01014894.1.p1  ORF type:complete len:536 (+),score=178.69 GHUV01014894.1:286-1893(+)
MGAEQSTLAPADQANAANGTKPGPRALVVCGPSGVGKGTLMRRLMEGPDAAKFAFSVSHTTRKPRPNEKDGVHYFFTTRQAFEQGIADGQFLETAEVHGNLYGTSKQAVQDTLAANKVSVMDVDVQGARQIRATGVPAYFVFIAPPSLEELEKRLRGRGTESPTSMSNRIKNARQEISSLNERGLFDYLLLNDDLETTAAELARIAERAYQGLPPEPGQVPDEVRFEEESDESAANNVTNDQQIPGTPNSNAAAAAAAGMQAAAALPPVDSGHIGTSSPPQTSPSPDTRPDRSTLPAAVAGASPTRHAGTAAVQKQGNDQPPQQQQSQQQQHAVQQEPKVQQQREEPEQQQLAGPSGAAAGATVAAGLDAWHGKVALVTGASSGIGWAVCEALGRAGLRVVAVARRRERLQELQQVVLGPTVGMAPTDFLPVVCDITKEAEVLALPKIILKHWPDAGVDVLVNNAGLSRNDASMFDGNTASWIEMVSTNILGNAMATRMAVQDMRRRGTWGHIINMVGLSGHRIPDAPAGEWSRV